MLIKSFICFRLISMALLLSWAVANQIRAVEGPRRADGSERSWLWSPVAVCLPRRREENLPCSLSLFNSFQICFYLAWQQTNLPAGFDNVASAQIIMIAINRWQPVNRNQSSYPSAIILALFLNLHLTFSPLFYSLTSLFVFLPLALIPSPPLIS